MKRIALLLTAALTACGTKTTGVVSTGPDTYMLAGTSNDRSPDGVTAELYRGASAYCAEQKKQLKSLGLTDRVGSSARRASAKLDFKCVEKEVGAAPLAR
jgi:hypothetical protein